MLYEVITRVEPAPAQVAVRVAPVERPAQAGIAAGVESAPVGGAHARIVDERAVEQQLDAHVRRAARGPAREAQLAEHTRACEPQGTEPVV